MISETAFWETVRPEDLRAMAGVIDPRERDEGGWSHLHYAAAFSPDPRVIRVLVDLGAEVNARTAYGSTPLHAAATDNPNPQVLAALLDLGAEVDARDHGGGTPLHRAVVKGRLDAIRLLLERGADPNATDRLGWTPLHQAAALNPNPQVAFLLVRYGAHPGARDLRGWTPLEYALERAEKDPTHWGMAWALTLLTEEERARRTRAVA